MIIPFSDRIEWVKVGDLFPKTCSYGMQETDVLMTMGVDIPIHTHDRIQPSVCESMILTL